MPARILDSRLYEPVLSPTMIIVVTCNTGVIFSALGELHALVNTIASLLGNHEAGVFLVA